MLRIKSLLAISIILSAVAGAAELHVAPTGSDSNPGSEEKPFLTLEKARDAARNMDGAKTITIHGGTYRLTKTLKIDERDSDATWCAAEGQEVFVTGGIAVSLKDLKQVEDSAVLQRIPQQSRSKVVELILPGKGSGGSETWPLRFRGYAGWPEVYVGGKSMRLARWPNEGYATIAKVLDKGSLPRDGEKPDRGGSFKFKENNPATWKPGEPIYLGGYWCFKWYDEFLRVASIDSENKIISMAAPHQYGLGGASKGLYFAINLLEELDQPGEYVYDGKRHALYMLIPEDVKDTLHVAVLREPLVVIKNAKGVTLKGITFENGCASAIDISDCESVRVENCTIRQMSGAGVTVNSGKACGVDRCRIHTIGKTGVSLAGGDRKTLTPSKHFVTNSEISEFARLVKTYCPAVGLAGVGQIVSNNHFYDAPHCAVLFGGNDHQIAFNHIERVCLDTSDAGAIYCGRDWTLGGNVVQGNFIHNLGASVHHENLGIYLDDMASGVEVSRNIVMDTDSGFLIGGGRNNVITTNLFVNCGKQSIRFDARGTGWVSKSRTWLNKPDGTMWQRLKSVPYATGVWAERFPYLASIEGDAFKEPRHNIVTGNLVFKSSPLDLDKLVTQHGSVTNNVVADTLPEIVLKNSQLSISDPTLKLFESMTIGPK